MNERSGACLCGDVQYTLSAEPLSARICWCKDCQKFSANGLANIHVPSESIRLSGTLSEFVSTAASGNRITRRFCPRCGTHLFANSSARPQFTVVRVGTLENPSSIRPTTNIWVDSAPAWACLDLSIESVGRQPPQPPAR